jgi:CDP-diacylglycerol--glycerol-3-phosphate 3-phosphatidyltransferase
MTLPNKLTLTRIVLTVVFVMALLLPAGGIVKSHFPLSMTGALLIFVVASLTDWLDGEIARRRNQETSFGALLDPLADKILTTAAFICFIEQNDFRGNALVQAWMVLVIVARDFLVTGLRVVAREQGVVLRAEQLAKHKTASQMVTIIVVLLGLAGREDWNCFGQNCERFDAAFSRLVFVLMLVTVALTVWSGIAYLYKNRKLFLQDA